MLKMIDRFKSIYKHYKLTVFKNSLLINQVFIYGLFIVYSENQIYGIIQLSIPKI